jgi:membrane associated rhomboid family serine protease
MDLSVSQLLRNHRLTLAEGSWQLARIRNYSMDDAGIDASSLRFTAWLKSKPLSGYTVILGCYILIVGAAQVFAGAENSIRIAGLVKSAVWQGEVWRLFTANLMLVNFTHFWLNSLALLHFSKIIEQTIHRSYVPFVFLLAGLIGSLLSVILYPHTTSIGASGGLMGLLGFITMAAYFDKNKYPPG